MTLSQSDRTAIHQSLVPLMGEQAAEALMGELPTTEDDELVTKQFLRAELSELRSEIHIEIAGLHQEILRGNNRLLLSILPTIIAGMAIAAAVG